MIEISDLQMKYNLSPSLAKILRLLVDEKIVTLGMIEHEHRLTSDAKIAIHRLRRRLEGSPVEIKSRKKLGYWLEVTSKDAIRNALAAPKESPLDHGGESTEVVSSAA